jgi:hypothetical protein
VSFRAEPNDLCLFTRMSSSIRTWRILWPSRTDD